MSSKFSPKQILIATFTVLLSSYISYAAGLASSVMTARALGPEEYGRFAYFVWLTGIIVVVFINGITVTLIRYVSESAGENNIKAAIQQEKWLKSTLWKSIVITSILCISAYRYLGLEITSMPIALVTVFAILCGVSKSLYIFDVSKAKGYGNFAIEPKTSSLLAILTAILSGLAFYTKLSIEYFIGIFILASLLHPILSNYYLNRADIETVDTTPPYKPDHTFRKHLYWSALLCLVALSTNRAVETYMLNVHFGPIEVGVFIVAATLFRASLDLVTVGLNAVLMPVLGNGLGVGGNEQVKSITTRSVKYMFFVGLLFSGCVFFFADPLVLVLYGDNYKDSSQAFKILTIVGGITITSGIFGAYLSFTNRQQGRAIISLVGAVVQCMVAVIVVPEYGIWGAVASTSIGMVITHALLIYKSCENNSLSLPIGDFISVFLIFLSALYIANIFYSNFLGLLPKILTGLFFALGFITASIVFKYWKKDDYVMLNKNLNQETQFSKIISAFERYSS